MKRITRRDFITRSIAAGFALAQPFSRTRGANDEIRVAVVGPIKSGKSTFLNSILQGDFLRRPPSFT